MDPTIKTWITTIYNAAFLSKAIETYDEKLLIAIVMAQPYYYHQLSKQNKTKNVAIALLYAVNPSTIKEILGPKDDNIYDDDFVDCALDIHMDYTVLYSEAPVEFLIKHAKKHPLIFESIIYNSGRVFNESEISLILQNSKYATTVFTFPDFDDSSKSNDNLSKSTTVNYSEEIIMKWFDKCQETIEICLVDDNVKNLHMNDVKSQMEIIVEHYQQNKKYALRALQIDPWMIIIISEYLLEDMEIQWLGHHYKLTHIYTYDHCDRCNNRLIRGMPMDIGVRFF